MLRKIHKERNKAMLADPLKSKGRGAYAAQMWVQICPLYFTYYWPRDASSQAANSTSGPSEARRPDVAHKETIRGREARQAVHGVNCPCCTGVSPNSSARAIVHCLILVISDSITNTRPGTYLWKNARRLPPKWSMMCLDTVRIGKRPSLLLDIGKYTNIYYLNSWAVKLTRAPPNWRQMGFPSTLQVERLNEEAAMMKREKQEKERKSKQKDLAM